MVKSRRIQRVYNVCAVDFAGHVIRVLASNIKTRKAAEQAKSRPVRENPTSIVLIQRTPSRRMT